MQPITIALFCVLLLLARVEKANARDKALPGVVLGVNATELIRKGDARWRQAIDDMAKYRVTTIRVAIRPPIESVPELVAYAKSKNINVLLIIMTGLESFYPRDVKPRPGGSRYWSVRPLSKIDTALFESFWQTHRRQMQLASVEAIAYQLGNEINNPDFNGDFPIETPGKVISLDACDASDNCTAIEEGYRKYVELLRIVRESGELKGIPLIAAGMANIDPKTFHGAGGRAVRPEAAIRILFKLGAAAYVDAFAIHVYPAWTPKAPQTNRMDAVMADSLNMALGDCTLSGHTNRPCWITEWGLRSKTAGCEPDEYRDMGHRAMVGAMRAPRFRGRLIAAFYYDWQSQDQRWGIFRCDRLMAPEVLSPGVH